LPGDARVGTRNLRALVLAAGYGTRLRPLTDDLPKPLLPVLGAPLLARTLDVLAAVGSSATAINLHHRAEAIPAAFGDRHRGMPLVYSREEPILGTSGAFVPLRDFFAGADTVLLVNGDSLCDWPLAELLARHRRRGAVATMLLAGRPDPRPFGGGIGIDRGGRVTAIRSEPTFGPVVRRHVYAGAYALSPRLLDRLPPGFSDSMNDLFPPVLAAGERIDALVTWRPWHDLGTPARYLDALRDLARREGPHGYRGEGARVEADADVRDAVLERDSSVGAGASVEASLVMPGARVGARSRLRRVVVGPDAAVPPESEWSAALLTRWHAAATTLPGSRREGDLLVTPF